MPTIIQRVRSSLESRYAIESEVGRGGMATVFRARDLRHDRTVALKVLDPELAAILGVDRFLAEIRVMARLQHPNLLPLFDSGDANGLPFYVMPFVDGESLRARLDRDRQLPVDEAIRITASVASALEYAHAHGIIHRDLKPENILLQAGQPVVADFGIALALSNAGGTRFTQTGLSLGTPQYMSPEQASGDRIVDGRSDIYSLGVLLYEMLTGAPPHSAPTLQAVMALLMTERPRAVRTLRPAVPEHVESAIDRALEKLPADRWTSAREFADALHDRTPAGRATGVVRDVASAGRTWRARSRDPVVLTLGALAMTGLSTAMWNGRVATREPDRFAVRIPITVERPPSEGGTFSLIAISPDGRHVAYAQREDRIGVWIHSLVDMSSRLVAPGGLMPFFSPDGAWLGYRTPTGRLHKIPVGGGEATPLLQLPSISGASWARGGIVIANAGQLLIVPEEGGSAELFVPLDSASGETGQRNPRVLPDGSTVLYESTRADGEPSRIGVASLTSSRRAILDLPGGSPIGVIDGYLIYGTPAGSIMAARFDVSRQRIEGSPVSVLGDVDIGVDAGLDRGPSRAAISATGTIVYAAGSPSSHIVLADMQGTTRVIAEEQRKYATPRFSPDGTRLAFGVHSSEGSDVWIRDLPSGTTSKLTNDGSSFRPEWHPDGKRVLFSSRRDGGRTQLWMQNADMSGNAELVQRAPQRVSGRRLAAPPTQGVFSPADPDYLLSMAGSDLRYRSLSKDSAATPFAETPENEMAGKFSPDGKWVAYASTGERAIQVFVQPFPPTTGARYKVTESGGMTPVWAPSGDKIYYVWAGAIHVANVRTTPAFAVTSRQELFAGDYKLMVPPTANYDVSPDGKQFVLLRPVSKGEQLVVIHDWKYELRERTRADRDR